MTNVLIPTNFSTQSLELINIAALNIPGRLNIFLFHAFDMPDSLIDAMHLVGIKNPNNLITEELRIKCRHVKAANTNISNISFRLMHGTTVAAFKNFADANNIHVILYPAGYTYMPVVRDSVNPERMFLKSGIKVLRDISYKANAAPASRQKPEAETRQKTQSTAAMH